MFCATTGLAETSSEHVNSFPRYYFIVTNSRLPAFSVVKVYNGRGDVENRIKEGKNTLRWDKTSCHRFAANEARLKMDFLAYNLLHLIRRFNCVLKKRVDQSSGLSCGW